MYSLSVIHSVSYNNFDFLLTHNVHTIRNIIDVAAMDSHNLEPQELNDRMRLYSHKLSQQWGTLQEDSMSVANGMFTNIMHT